MPARPSCARLLWPQVCDGSSKDCPKEDKKHPWGTICKAPIHGCDMPGAGAVP